MSSAPHTQSSPGSANNPQPIPRIKRQSTKFPFGFPGWLLLAMVVTVIGGHWFAADLWQLTHALLGECVLVVFAPAVAGLLVSAAFLFWCRHYWHREQAPWMLLPLSGFVFSVQWIALELHHLLHLPLLTAAMGFVMFLIGVMWAHRLRHHLERGQSKMQSKAEDYQPGIQALVIPVSLPEPPPVFADKVKRSFPVTFTPGLKGGDEKQPETATLVGGPNQLGGDIQQLDAKTRGWSGYANWQQLLRAIQPHQTSLRHLRLIGSPASSSDDMQKIPAYLLDAEAFLRSYLPALQTVRCSLPVDFEDFNAIHAALDDAIHDLEHHYVPLPSIAVDLTGGFKVATAASAVITLNSKVVSQYVQSRSPITRPGAPQVLIYDFAWDKSMPSE